jgi:YidC/Oxa1 family membrane protein insertase
MPLWNAFVDLLQAVLGVATQLFGGNLAAGIIGVSLTLRLALLPLTYAMARESQRRAILLKRLEPELRRLRERYQTDPSRLMTEHALVLRRHGLQLVDTRSLLGSIVQMPFVLGMYTAVRRALLGVTSGRFAWIQNITRPDTLLAALVAGLTGMMMVLSPHTHAPSTRVLLVVPAIITFFVLLKLSAGYGLYWGASSLIGTIQNLLLRRVRAAG